MLISLPLRTDSKLLIQAKIHTRMLNNLVVLMVLIIQLIVEVVGQHFLEWLLEVEKDWISFIKERP